MSTKKDSHFHRYLSVPVKSLLTGTAAELDISAIRLIRESVRWYCKALLKDRGREDLYQYLYTDKLISKYADIYGDDHSDE
jgi:hypothetical protein